ncbi:MAG: HNH endonuclease family protein [Candidatus Nanopelagicaceae bacterium]
MKLRSIWAIALVAILNIPNANAAETSIETVLESLAVKGRAPKTGYTRAQFGQTWADVNRNGCDTRNDILQRDLTNLSFRTGTRDCVVESGKLVDPYSGITINFIKGVKSSMEVQIDHVVALSNAWQTGAFKLTIEKRTQFANDPDNLLAVQGRLNSQKGDGDAATWLPPLKSYRCTYVTKQIAVKAKYGLWVSAPEKAAMKSILAKC